MWESRVRVWTIFMTWIGLGSLSAYVDYSRQRTIALPIFLIGSFVTTYFASRNTRPSRFKFELLNHDSKGVRSPLGFEVRITSGGIEYREGDHTLLFRHFGDQQPVQVFGLDFPPNAKWAAPFEVEPISENKRKEISRAIIARSRTFKAQIGVHIKTGPGFIGFNPFRFSLHRKTGR